MNRIFVSRKQFLGGAFVYHYAPHPVPFKGADRSHPAIACLPEDYVWAKDEIYVHKVTKDARVLLKLPSAAIPEKEKERWRKMFKEMVDVEAYDLEWVKDFGKGRVFFTALGHFPADFKKPAGMHFSAEAPWVASRLTKMMTDAQLLWFKTDAELRGISVWQSLRRYYSPMEIIRSRVIYILIMKIPPCRWAFHQFLAKTGRCFFDERV